MDSTSTGGKENYGNVQGVIDDSSADGFDNCY